jgi:hypothetical protein
LRLLRIGRALRHEANIDGQPALCVDTAVTVRGLVLAVGWLREPYAPVEGLSLITPAGAAIRQEDAILRHPRRDVTDHFKAQGLAAPAAAGFTGLFSTSRPINDAHAWLIEARYGDGSVRIVPIPDLIREPVAARDAILQFIRERGPLSQTCMKEHIFPVMSAIAELQSARVRIASTEQYGSPPADPAVTIVIPLFGRIDFLEHQMAHWALDGEIGHTDLIYVLDSPELEPHLSGYAAQLYELYHLPFRLAVMSENSGFGQALGRMTSVYAQTASVGALGAKLLYEDDTIQHAGVFFQRMADGIWRNQHYFKGLHRKTRPASVDRAIPAVTGACLLIATELYQRMGGLGRQYVLGDYEDTDLCLRLNAAGYRNWYTARAELYHLEGQSYPSSTRIAASTYNAWLQTHLLGGQLTQVMAHFGSDKDS